jgi:glycine/D-amino acid oxidase-like deaminating enzyme
VAVDGGLTTILPELSADARSVRLQMVGTATEASAVTPFATGTRWGWDYFQQTASGAIALGGCRDVGGEGEYTTDASPSPDVQGALERRLHDDLGVAAPITHRWAAVVSYTESAVPILREVRPHVWAVGAYSGTGNLLGAAMARIAARRSLGLAAPWPLDD